MSSFLTRGRSKIAVTVNPSADSRYFTLDMGEKRIDEDHGPKIRGGVIVADVTDTGREAGVGCGRERNGDTRSADLRGFSFL